MKLLASVLLLITLIPTAFSHKMQSLYFMLGTVQKNARILKTTFWKVVLKRKVTFVFAVKSFNVNFLHLEQVKVYFSCSLLQSLPQRANLHENL